MPTIPKLPDGATEYHILGRVDDPASVARRIVEKAVPGAVIIDLSAGQLNSPHQPHRDIPADLLASITWINGQHLAPEIGDASRNEYVKWLSEAADQPVAHGKSIKEWFTYKGEISLWWFVGISLRHSTNQPQRWWFYQHYALKQLAEKAQENQTWHFWTGHNDEELLTQVAPASVSNRLHSLEALSSGKKNKKSFRDSVRDVFKRSDTGMATLIMQQAVRIAAGTLKKLSKLAKQTSDIHRSIGASHPLWPENRSHPLVLVQTKFPKSWAPVPDAVDLKISDVSYDHYFGDAPAQLSAQGYQTAWLTSIEPGSEDGNKWKETCKTQSIPDATPWMVLKQEDAWQIAYHQLRWALLYIYLFIWKDIDTEWTYEGIPLGHWFKDTYHRRAWHSSGIFADIERYRHAFESLKPTAVLYRDEFYLTNGRRLSAAGTGRTTLVGVQHGMVSRDHTVYQWHPDDIGEYRSVEQSDHVYHAPVPDYFAAFGEHYVDQFEAWGGYPADRAVPVGGLRHDVLVEKFNLKEKRSERTQQRKALRTRYNLPQDKPILLLCTGTEESAGVWFRMVVEALQCQSTNAFVAVKLHQYHGGECDVRAVADERRFDAYEVYTEDVYPLMEASDVLITSASTTLLEGRLFGMKGIAICATADYQTYPFSDAQLASVVTNVEEMEVVLTESIQKIEEDLNAEEQIFRHLLNLSSTATAELDSFLKQVMP